MEYYNILLHLNINNIMEHLHFRNGSNQCNYPQYLIDNDEFDNMGESS